VNSVSILFNIDLSSGNFDSNLIFALYAFEFLLDLVLISRTFDLFVKPSIVISTFSPRSLAGKETKGYE